MDIFDISRLPFYVGDVPDGWKIKVQNSHFLTGLSIRGNRSEPSRKKDGLEHTIAWVWIRTVAPIP
jgi:hypothetical protein